MTHVRIALLAMLRETLANARRFGTIADQTAIADAIEMIERDGETLDDLKARVESISQLVDEMVARSQAITPLLERLDQQEAVADANTK